MLKHTTKFRAGRKTGIPETWTNMGSPPSIYDFLDRIASIQRQRSATPDSLRARQRPFIPNSLEEPDSL
jgi:hypothetical protein